ncbi:MAG: hypothetical protein GY895_11100 [Phycisphaera sp.]|nr:hypothetical protein [Phycisphaera sp.]
MQVDEVVPGPETVGTGWVEVALVVFILVFAMVLAWVLLTSSARWRRDASIPLRDDVVSPRNEREVDDER